VARANFLEKKRMLNIPTVYTKNKLPNMCMLLNDSRTQLKVMVMVMVTATKPKNPMQHLQLHKIFVEKKFM
jgi:hypothetical protein